MYYIHADITLIYMNKNKLIKTFFKKRRGMDFAKSWGYGVNQFLTSAASLLSREIRLEEQIF